MSTLPGLCEIDNRLKCGIGYEWIIYSSFIRLPGISVHILKRFWLVVSEQLGALVFVAVYARPIFPRVMGSYSEFDGRGSLSAAGEGRKKEGKLKLIDRPEHSESGRRRFADVLMAWRCNVADGYFLRRRCEELLKIDVTGSSYRLRPLTIPGVPAASRIRYVRGKLSENAAEKHTTPARVVSSKSGPR